MSKGYKSSSSLQKGAGLGAAGGSPGQDVEPPARIHRAAQLCGGGKGGPEAARDGLNGALPPTRVCQLYFCAAEYLLILMQAIVGGCSSAALSDAHSV